MELADLRLLLAIGEAGSITGGAAAQHLSLPAASARLRLLERQTGSSLFDRHRRGVTPTQVGVLLLTQARELIRAADRLEADLAAFAETSVRLLVNTTGASTLTRALTGFLAAHPEVSIDVDSRPSAQIVTALAEGRADIGVLADSVPHGDLDILPLRPDPLVAATSSTSERLQPGPTSLARLLDHPHVGLSRGTPFGDHIDGHARPYGRGLGYRLRLPTFPAVVDAVEADIGIAILPADSLTGRPGVTTRPLTDGWAHRNLVLGTARTTRPSTAAASLHAHLVATVRAGGSPVTGMAGPAGATG